MDQNDQPLPTVIRISIPVTRALMVIPAVAADPVLTEMLLAREARGIKTYGRTLNTFNGRDVDRDLVEELVDAAQYALQSALERAVLNLLFALAVKYRTDQTPETLGELVALVDALISPEQNS